MPSDCLLENSFLVKAPSQLVEQAVAVLQNREVDPLLVGTIRAAIQGVAPRSPSLCLSLGDQACMSMSLRLWSMYRLYVMSLFPKFVRSTFRPRTSFVSNLGQIVDFLHLELLIQLSYQVTQKLIVPVRRPRARPE